MGSLFSAWEEAKSDYEPIVFPEGSKEVAEFSKWWQQLCLYLAAAECMKVLANTRKTNLLHNVMGCWGRGGGINPFPKEICGLLTFLCVNMNQQTSLTRTITIFLYLEREEVEQSNMHNETISFDYFTVRCVHFLSSIFIRNIGTARAF